MEQLTKNQIDLLNKLGAKQSLNSNLLLRVKILLMLFVEKLGSRKTAQRLNTTRSTVKKWRKRWQSSATILNDLETKYVEKKLSNTQYSDAILEVLADSYRSGCPAKITEEQKLCIVALACMTPESLDLPFTHWTRQLLATETMTLNIVDKISASHIGNILNDAELQPHRNKYWIHPNIEDLDELKLKIEEIKATHVTLDNLIIST